MASQGSSGGAGLYGSVNPAMDIELEKRLMAYLVQISKLPVVLFHLFPDGQPSLFPLEAVVKAVCEVYAEETREYKEAAAAAAASSSSSAVSHATSPNRCSDECPRDLSPEWSSRAAAVAGVVPRASTDLRSAQIRPANPVNDVPTARDGGGMSPEELDIEIAMALSMGRRVFRVKKDAIRNDGSAHSMAAGEVFVEVPIPGRRSTSREGVWSWGYKIGGDGKNQWFLNDSPTVDEIS
ncbi:hypothetical protein FOL47_004099 [Perkinsus chesapeaki]|uniref:Uncharacterized protein n=1 Tax=Perkinsus chesapeaki TaxID=330153 RepID=A0A7J6M5U2_PERCH|nr:hypothetical protein FOL47_004099 [Perkinsus chesapeaki]